MVSHGDLGMISASIASGDAPAKMIRYSDDPDDGWWVLAAADLPLPRPENLRAACLHCLIEGFDSEIAAGLELARADSGEDSDGVGVAVWEGGYWLTGVEALEAI
jgi:hypothetical protein